MRVEYTKHQPRHVKSAEVGQLCVELRILSAAVDTHIARESQDGRRDKLRRQRSTLYRAALALDHYQDILDSCETPPDS